jgi:acetaldehyde dehydrogenase (acetylating)
MAAAVGPHAEALARLAVEETGFGVVADKVQKNLFASDRVHAFIRPMKTVGVIARHEATKVVEIAEPFGVVAAIVPSTNPTSTAIYKILIAIKARCAIVISPHPSAARCITRVAEIMSEAAKAAGAPDGAIGWLTTVTLEARPRRVQRRQARLRCRPRQRPLLCRVVCRSGQGRQRHHRRQVLRQRRPLLVTQLRRRR